MAGSDSNDNKGSDHREHLDDLKSRIENLEFLIKRKRVSEK